MYLNANSGINFVLTIMIAGYYCFQAILLILTIIVKKTALALRYR